MYNLQLSKINCILQALLLSAIRREHYFYNSRRMTDYISSASLVEPEVDLFNDVFKTSNQNCEQKENL